MKTSLIFSLIVVFLRGASSRVFESLQLYLLMGLFWIFGLADAQAQTTWANSGSGDWNTSINWSPAAVPGSSTTVYIDNGGTSLLSTPGDQSGVLVIGNTGTGNLQITNGGTLTNVNGLLIGYQSHSSGSLLIDGTGSSWTNTDHDVYVGLSGTGSLTLQNGGSASIPEWSMYVGVQPGSTGSVIVNGSGSSLTIGSASTISDQALRIGAPGSPPLTHNGSGSLLVENGGSVTAYDGGAVVGPGGGLTVTGTNSIFTGSFSEAVGGSIQVAGGGTAHSSGTYNGILTVTGAGSSVTRTTGSSGYYGTTTIQNGGTLSESQSFLNGSITIDGASSTWADSSSLIIQGGAVSVQNGGLLSTPGGATIFAGAVTVDGASSAWQMSGADLYVGTSKPGTLTIRNGGTVTSLDSYLYVGSVTVNGTNSAWSAGNTLAVGSSTSGSSTAASSLLLQNGGQVTNNIGTVGTGNNASVTIDGSGSNWTSYTSLQIGNGSNSYTGLITVENDGILQVGTGGSGNISVKNTGTLQVGTGGAPGAITAGSIQLSATTAQLIFDQDQNLYTFSPSISGSGSITQEGSGITILTGNNSSFSGKTFINGGELTLNSSNALGTNGTISFGGGSLQFTSNNTTDYSSRYSTAAGQKYAFDTNGQSATLAGTLTSSGGTLTKTGAGTLLLSGTGSNTYSGVTTVSGGELDLGKTAGAVAITGAGAKDVTNPDILVNGGTVKWIGSEEVGNTATLLLSSGTVNLNGQSETLWSFKNSGGTFSTGTGGTLKGLGTTVTWSGGTNTINPGGTVEDQHVVISGGTNTVQGGSTGGTLKLDSGGTGLEITGANLTLNSDDTSPGRLLLGSTASTSANVTSHASSITATISNGAGGTNPGVIDLNGGTSTFTTEQGTTVSGIDLDISAKITNGSLTKAGVGTLQLGGTNSYTGATTVEAGTLRLATGSSIAASTTTINNGGTLTGTGTAGGLILESGGMIDPGNSPASPTGTLSASSLTWDAGGQLTFDLHTANSSTSLLSLTGALIKSGNGAFTINFGGGSAIVGTTYDLINFASTNGINGASPGGFTANNFSVGTNTGGLSGRFQILNGGTELAFEVIPEPGTGAMFLFGFLLLFVAAFRFPFRPRMVAMD